MPGTGHTRLFWQENLGFRNLKNTSLGSAGQAGLKFHWIRVLQFRWCFSYHDCSCTSSQITETEVRSSACTTLDGWRNRLWISHYSVTNNGYVNNVAQCCSDDGNTHACIVSVTPKHRATTIMHTRKKKKKKDCSPSCPCNALSSFHVWHFFCLCCAQRSDTRWPGF